MRAYGNLIFAAASPIGLLIAVGIASIASANDGLLTLQQNPAEWVMPNGNYSSTRYSALTQINKDNVGELELAWTFSTGVLRGHEGGPLVIGDVMYIATPFPNIVYALDLNDEGRVIWKYEEKQDPNFVPVMCCDAVNRGVAYADGRILLSRANTTLVALDAATGAVLWQVKNGDPLKGETSTAAPLVYKDKVYVGISGGEFGVQGRLTAYNVKDGSLVWNGFSTGPDDLTLMDPEKTTHLGKPVGKDSGTATWEGDQWKIGGGAAWGWYSVDPELNLIYYGTGNPGTWNPVQRPGDNRWSTTIFARDADTGMAKWVYQMTPADEWAYAGVNEMILADIPVKGKETKALVHFDRNGFAYTMDRVTGELLVAEKYDPAVNWATHVDMETGRPQVVSRYSPRANGENVNVRSICPAEMGTKDTQPAAFSPKTGLFYVPTNHVCMDYEPFRVSYTAGQPYVGATVSMYPAPGGTHLGNFIAWDASAGKIVWSIPEPTSVWSGALATAGDVVFYGTLEGYLKAVDARTGRELFRFQTPSSIMGNVNTWMHEGQQYVGVLSSFGSQDGISLAAGLTENTDGLGAVGAYKSPAKETSLGPAMYVFTLAKRVFSPSVSEVRDAHPTADGTIGKWTIGFATNRQVIQDAYDEFSFTDRPGSRLTSGNIEYALVNGKIRQTGSWSSSPEDVIRSTMLSHSNRRRVIYVHGFNTSFDDAAIESARLTRMLKADVLLFSWPTIAGGITDIPQAYVNGKNGLRGASTFLADLLEKMHAITNGPLDGLICHSMGCDIAFGALLDLQQKHVPDAVRHTIFVAPDVDRNEFLNNIHHLKQITKQVSLYVAENDRALSISRDSNRGDRLGQRAVGVDASAIDVVDVSFVAKSQWNHNHLADDSVLFDIFQALNGQDPQFRFGLQEVISGQRRVWTFLPYAD